MIFICKFKSFFMNSFHLVIGFATMKHPYKKTAVKLSPSKRIYYGYKFFESIKGDILASVCSFWFVLIQSCWVL